ncbi:sodium-dependent transporter [Haloplanus aerogenes]|uniref:NSS family neurotransmitter:Na+ symporter n=1 Tax=Haloplanus aerogenes TaxID=660522 RepID=A0A3M0E0V2_9EURY|nr:sodium-dependent transporter [Haloplanus aerogenes]AZH25816.1 sodium-dependent transporter [Haloplanus aerogenes]RMB25556.1 NSS family neurotransmitter:Na+ symporter [Haloplanus aerogenes]
MTRETWATRTGFILAAAGSAVGLGNIWRFPWMTAQNGGSAFLAVYLLVVFGVGVPGLLGEFVIGRRARRNPMGALRDLSGSRRWAAVGAVSAVTGVALLSFYSVVGGWILRYLLVSMTGPLTGGAAYLSTPGAYFETISFGFEAAAFHLLFLAITGGIVLGGVRRGIELGTKVMVPAVLVLLVGMAAWVVTQPGAGAGYQFFLGFDLTTLRENFFSILGPAAGQALFTLSVGAGTMVTYASYLGEDRSLPFDGSVIALLNTGVGVLAGLVVFPLLFSQGVDPGTGGPGALFVGIAGAFAALPGGGLLAIVFFGVVTLAALSSSISMLEIPVAVLVDEGGWSRRAAVGVLLALVAVTGTVTALRPALFDFVAGTLVDLLLTGGLLAFLLFAGWVLGRDAVAEYVSGAGPVARQLATPWLFAVGIVIPVFLVFTLLTTAGIDARVGFWPTVGVAVAAVAVVLVGLRRQATV